MTDDRPASDPPASGVQPPASSDQPPRWLLYLTWGALVVALFVTLVLVGVYGT